MAVYLLASTSAFARVDLELNVGAPGYMAPAPVYAPAYAAPAPVYVAPYPSYYDPYHRRHDWHYWQDRKHGDHDHR